MKVAPCFGFHSLPLKIHVFVNVAPCSYGSKFFKICLLQRQKKVAADLKEIYAAVSETEAEAALESFENEWDKKYPAIAKSWKNNWNEVTPFFKFPDDIRRAIYTTNAIESLNSSLRKLLKNRGPFPSDDAVYKLFYLGIRKLEKRWTLPIRNWKAAIN